MKTMKIAVLCVLLATLTGCAYLSDRGRDFADCWRLSGSLHLGVTAQARALVFGYGTGLAATYRVGTESKGIYQRWKEKEMGFPVMNLLGLWGVTVHGSHKGCNFSKALTAIMLWGGYSSFGTIESDNSEDVEYKIIRSTYIPVISFPVISEPGRKFYEDITDLFWIEAGGGAIIGIRAGFNLAEFSDFLLGWTTLDILGDDVYHNIPEELEGLSRSNLLHIKNLKDKDNMVRLKAADALAKSGDKRVVKPLIAALKDKVWDTRWFAARALGELGDERAVGPLKKALAVEKNDWAREAIQAAIKKLESVPDTP